MIAHVICYHATYAPRVRSYDIGFIVRARCYCVVPSPIRQSFISCPHSVPVAPYMCVVWCVLRVACCGLLCYVLACIVVRLKVDIALRCCRGLPMDIFRSAIPMRWMLWSRRLLLKLFMHIHSWIGMWLTYNDGRYLTHALAHPFDTCPPREDP